jgi:hypothetical protein
MFDISDPAFPVELVPYDIPTGANSVAVADSRAYVADTNGDLHIIDVTIPGAPFELGFYDCPVGLLSVEEVHEGHVYALSAEGVCVVDVQVPAAPVLYGYYDTPGTPRALDLNGGLIYVADFDHGMMILEFSHGPSGAQEMPRRHAGLLDIYPNPFNPSTSIAYEAVAGAHVRLTIYDVAGRLILRLVDEPATASGRQGIIWNGRDYQGRLAASGVYLCHLETAGYNETKRMVLNK